MLTRLAVALSISILTVFPALAAPGEAVARQVAEAHGLSSWDSVDVIRYTFNVRRDAGDIHRTWEWEPHTGQVTLVSSSGDEETPFTYNTHAVTEASAEAVRTVDQRFINDQYWLLFPFHTVWDEGVTLTDEGFEPNPVGAGDVRRLRVAYGGEGGYTPGETFIRGSEGEGSVFAWEDPVALGPLTVYQSFVRAGSDEPGIFFTDLSAVIDGEEVGVEE
jgi:hypothetical protein